MLVAVVRSAQGVDQTPRFFSGWEAQRLREPMSTRGQSVFGKPPTDFWFLGERYGNLRPQCGAELSGGRKVDAAPGVGERRQASHAVEPGNYAPSTEPRGESRCFHSILSPTRSGIAEDSPRIALLARRNKRDCQFGRARSLYSEDRYGSSRISLSKRQGRPPAQRDALCDTGCRVDGAICLIV